MTAHHIATWASTHAWTVTALAVLIVAALIGAARALAVRTNPAVLGAGIGALICTAYTGDTSWRFAEHRLGMHDFDERAAMFAAGEVALLACAIMARANKKATATDESAGTPGVPGVLVWCITGIQVIPAFSESGFWGGIVRAAIGPVMAGLLWHLAMGLEIRIGRPEALSTGLPAQIGHELRERLLSYIGLAERGRDAAQMTRDRATARTVRLASRQHLGWWGRAALKASVARSEAAIDTVQRGKLMAQLAGRRTALQLRDVPLDSPWGSGPGTVPEPTPVPEAVPGPVPGSEPAVLDGPALRLMDPFDAVLQVHAAYPDAHPARLVELCGGYGLTVAENEVRWTLQAAGRLPAQPVPDPVAAVAEPSQGAPVPDLVVHEYVADGLHFDVTTESRVRPEYACDVPADALAAARTRKQVRPRVPDGLGDLGYILSRTPRASLGAPGRRTRRFQAAVPDGPVPAVPGDRDGVPAPAGTPLPARVGEDQELARAREIDAEHRRKHNGRPAGIRVLKKQLGIGQEKAKRLRELLDAPQSATSSGALSA
ncbi:hypothetical protein ACFUEN_29015 [Streptomyces griseorubiginosus]|uniref:hypothetical protein n=1 Tax=Streptomyces griseorubiginosus TaxID=67304 RepID=UPI0036359384